MAESKKVSVLRLRKRRVPKTTGIRFDRCGMCETRLQHKDFSGVYVGQVFIVKGYKCPACGWHEGIPVSGRHCKVSVYPFDWRKLPIGRAGSQLGVMQS